MQEAPLAEDGAGERGLETLATVEPTPGAHQDVGRDAGPTQHLVGEPGAPAIGCSVVRHDDQEVVVAVRPSLAARPGAEEIYPLRPVGRNEPAEQLRVGSLTL
jgi:hypothetical protein